MGLLTRKTDSNPLSKNIDELLDGMNQEREETKEGTYEESLKKIVVLMSDGEPTEGKQKDGSYREPILSMANKMKQDNLMVYTLGFFHNLEGENLGECRQLMADIASEGYHYEVSSADSIQFVFDDIAQQVGGGEYLY